MVKLGRIYWDEIGNLVKRPKYLGLIVVITLAILIFFAWTPNRELLWETLRSPSIHPYLKRKLFWGITGSLFTNLHLFDLVMLVVSASLAGLQTALVVAHVRCKVRMGQVAGLSLIGTLSSLLGVGCSACGSVLLTGILGVSGAALLQKLPFKGMELGLLGIAVLALSIAVTTQLLHKTKSCILPTK